MKTGEVTPAGWLPGKPTIKPSSDLAGKAWKVRRKAIVPILSWKCPTRLFSFISL